jgi:short-subunit dehydrogenase
MTDWFARTASVSGQKPKGFMISVNQSMRDKVVIVTGASVGIGAALARELARRGAKVVLAARTETALQDVARDCPGSLVIPTDVTNPAACEALITRTIEHFGRLDVLVNNAGQSMLSRFEDIEDFSIFEKLIQVNYLSAVYCTRAALPHLKASKGLLVGISSVAGKTGIPLRTGYSASKHALQGFFDSLRIELIDTGIAVSVISPAFVDTGIRERSFGPDGKPLGRNPLFGKKIMSSEECAHQIADVIAARRRELIMGASGRLAILGKLIAPRLVDTLTRRKIEHGK